MRLGFVITGRMKSTRLPLKLTLKLLDKEVITWMIQRAKLAFKEDEIVIATSTHHQDDVLEEIANKEGIKIFRGHEDDVVLRLYEAAKENNFDYFVNITADCPLFGFDYIEKLKEIIAQKQPDLITSLELTHGIFVYAIKTQAFEEVIKMKSTDNTEVWGDYFYNNPDKFKVEALPVTEEEIRPDYRLTIDYPEDFEVFERIFNHFGQDTYKMSSNDIIKFLDENPEVVEINKDCKQKYQKRWESQIATKLEKK